MFGPLHHRVSRERDGVKTGLKGAVFGRLHARRVKVSTKRGTAVEKQFAKGGGGRGSDAEAGGGCAAVFQQAAEEKSAA